MNKVNNKNINKNNHDYKDNYSVDENNIQYLSNKVYNSGLLKLLTGLFDKYGIIAVDWAGEALGLNKNGKSISNQSMEELSSSLKELSEKLKNPELTNVFIETIRDAEPVIRELFFSILNLGLATGRLLAKNIVTFLCYETPAAPICGLFRFANNAIVFGEELIDSGRSSLNSLKKSQIIANNFIDNVSDIAKDSLNKVQDVIGNNLKKVEDNVENNLKKVEDNVGNSVKDKINKIENKIANNNFQKGGVKKIYKEKKEIENRINKSIHEFLYLKSPPNNKKRTRRRRKY
jgi:hypothetical protein